MCVGHRFTSLLAREAFDNKPSKNITSTVSRNKHLHSVKSPFFSNAYVALYDLSKVPQPKKSEKRLISDTNVI